MPTGNTFMTMHQCHSSQIARYGYNPDTDTLRIEFIRGGSTYDYANVTPEVFKGFLEADSKYSWFYHNIKKYPDLYPYARVE